MFTKIGVFSMMNYSCVWDTLATIIPIIKHQNIELLVEQNSVNNQDNSEYQLTSLDKITATCELIIVIGGDGNMLGAAKLLVASNIPILGINQGRLGFLTDITPHEISTQLLPILQGKYLLEERSMLSLKHNNTHNHIHTQALNDVVLHSSNALKLIEFEVYINKSLVHKQRSDGLIIATATGSTAYSLAAGGPIIAPDLDVITLVPICPHNLSSRPIVIDNKSEIKILTTPRNLEEQTIISCDGHQILSMKQKDTIYINKSIHKLRLIHPVHYNFYATCSKKLNWSQEIIQDKNHAQSN